ncbi:hypothetical protein [Chelativorans sp.]|uniref:hypothetical protein n=1 Tax=Chelativorans sp. TaxID=2203393 RepID=UPI002811BFE9|nr:hypothetical protein [Chelativorans sp.]
MWLVVRRFIFIPLVAAVSGAAIAQEQNPALDGLRLQGITEYASPRTQGPLALAAEAELVLAAKLTEDSPELPAGLTWRIFAPEPGPDGKLPLVASARGGTSSFKLAPGSYLVHAAYGRAGVTKRIRLGRESMRERLVLDAGGLKLDAVLPGDIPIDPNQLRFSIYEAKDAPSSEGQLIVPNVKPDAVVRLNAGTYHVISNYGPIATIRSDIRVEAGQLTEATVEHRAAQVTLKLVREPGGEAIADTQWKIAMTESDRVVFDEVVAHASIVLPEGQYTAVAINRDRTYQRDFTVTVDPKTIAADGETVIELLPEDLVQLTDGSSD